MKKFIYSAALALLALAATSCDLDKFPVDKVSSGDMQKVDNAVTATTGVYAMFKGPLEYNGFYTVGNTYIRHYSQLAEFKGDNILMSGKSTDPLFSDATMVDMAADTNLEYFWFISYKINYATSAIINVIPDDTDDAELRHIKGENYFMRAFSHMNLVQIFAFPYALKGRDEIGVVIRTGPAGADPITRATVGEVYDQVESDLKNAIKCMEGGSRRGDNGYIDVNAAKALLCRFYLYEQRYDECIALADEILGSDPMSHLESDYTTLFQNTRTSKEVLWCVALENVEGDYPGAQAMMGSMFYAFNVDAKADEDGGDPGDGSGWAEVYWSQPLMDLFDRYPGDQRMAKMRAQAHKSKTGAKMIYWPVVNADGFAENYIDRKPVKEGDNWTCKDANGKKYTVKTEIVNTYPKTYIELNGKKQYVTVADSMGCRIGTGGDMYPLNYMKKFSNQGGEWTNLGSPAQLRYAEVVLNRAEAYAHKKDVENALKDVNIIRKRANLPDVAMFNANNMKERGYDDVLDVVLDERRMELCFEGFRVLDMQRNNKSIDRQYAGRQPYEIVQPDDKRLRYWIPLAEVTTSGIPQNERY